MHRYQSRSNSTQDKELQPAAVTVNVTTTLVQPPSTDPTPLLSSSDSSSHVAIALIASVLLLQLILIVVMMMKNKSRRRSRKDKDEESSLLSATNHDHGTTTSDRDFKTLSPRQAFEQTRSSSSDFTTIDMESCRPRSNASKNVSAPHSGMYDQVHAPTIKSFSFRSPTPPLQVQHISSDRSTKNRLNTSTSLPSLKTQSETNSFHVHGQSTSVDILADLEAISANGMPTSANASTSTPLQNGIIAVTRTLGDPGVGDFCHYQARSLWKRPVEEEEGLHYISIDVPVEFDGISIDS